MKGTAEAVQGQPWAVLLLPSKLKRFYSTKVYAQGTRTELSLDDLTSSSPPSLIVESIVASISQNSFITLMPDGTDDTNPTPLTAFDCINLEARDFSRAASYCCSRIICLPKLLLNYNMYFTVHMFIFSFFFFLTII